MIQRRQKDALLLLYTHEIIYMVGGDNKAIINNMPNVNSLRSRRSFRPSLSLHDVVSSVSSILSPKAGAQQPSDSGWTRAIVAFSGIDPSEQVKKVCSLSAALLYYVILFSSGV